MNAVTKANQLIEIVHECCEQKTKANQLIEIVHECCD